MIRKTMIYPGARLHMPAVLRRSFHVLTRVIAGAFLLFSVHSVLAADSDLAGRFIESANKALAAGKLKEAEEYLNRAAAISPQDERVRQTRERVTAQKRAGEQARAEKQRAQEREQMVMGKVWKEPITGMEFMWIPKGCYIMGSPASESGRRSDEHQHEVCVDGYWLGKYEVTNAQYRLFMPSHDSGDIKTYRLNGDSQPVTNVSWTEAVAFAGWLSKKTGKSFRLPTEAEWEYAARAGTGTGYYWGDNDSQICRYANIYDRTKASQRIVVKSTAAACDDGYVVSSPVGRFVPNAYGLHDMIGNVSELTSSPYDEAYSGGEKRVTNAGYDGPVVARGGGAFSGLEYARVSRRIQRPPDKPSPLIGFRLARIP